MFSLDKIVEKICEHSKLDEDKVRKMIKEKKEELSGLVSEEGAAYIVAREHDVNLLRETKRQLKIKNLVSGLRSVDIVARVMKAYEPREFEKDGKKGKVVNVLLGDETGVVRLSLWNEEAELVESGKLKEGDTIKISHAYVKSDNRDAPELRVGRGLIEKTDQVIDIPPIENIEQSFNTVQRREIADFKEGQMNETRATLLQVFKRSPFFEVCPECGVRVKESEGKWACEDHGEVKPKQNIVISGIIDDGTGNIRAVFFRELAEKVFGKTAEELSEEAKKATDALAMFTNVPSLGKDFILKGRVKNNNFTERMEFVVNGIEDVDVKREAESLVKELSAR
jgi:replication factor A1